MNLRECFEYSYIKIFTCSNYYYSQETLDKMQERIELAQWNEESDPQMLKKLKENGGIKN